MVTINPKKLGNSKWTTVKPINKEKHFIITRLQLKKDHSISQIQMQAIMTKRKFFVQWQDLQNPQNLATGLEMILYQKNHIKLT